MGRIRHARIPIRIGVTALAGAALIALAYVAYRRFPQIIYPFLPYRSLAFPIFVLCLVVAPLWVIFRLYRRRNSGHALSFEREILLLTVVLYLSGLAAATLMPNRSSRLRAEGRGGIELHPRLASLTCASKNMPEGSRARGFCVRNARGNVLLFFPLGLLIPLLWRRVRFWKGLLIALALSCSIELVQYLSSAWGSYRAADVNDVILNVAGASLGLALMSLVRLRHGARRALPAPNGSSANGSDTSIE